MAEKVLITGVSGLLGSNTVVAFQKAGYKVRGLVRSRSNLLALDGIADIELSYGSILKEKELLSAMEGCSLVVHAAAETRQWGVSERQCYETNLQGTINMVEAARKTGVKRFIQVSTASVFQPGDLENPGDESQACDGSLSGTFYVASKLAADQYVRREVANGGLAAVIVNPTFMIGPRDAALSSGKMVRHYQKSRWVVCPPGGKNFVHVQDVANGIVGAMEKGATGRSYLLAGTNLSFQEFFRIVSEQTRLSRRLLPFSAGTLKSIGWSGDLIGKLAGTTMPFNRSSMALLSRPCFFSPQRAINELGMSQTSIDLAVREFLDWQAHHR